MSYQEENSKSTSWGFVIFVLIIFWPVGLYLVYKKLNETRSLTLKDGKGFRTVGWIFIVLEICVLIGYVNEGYIDFLSILISLFFLGGPGALMFYISNLKKKKSAKLKRYIAMISNNYETSIDNIATAIPTDYDSAVNDLNKMIDKGFFENAYIDASARKIILPQNKLIQLVAQQQEYENALLQSKIGQLNLKLTKVVVCKSCGANNQVKEGQISRCEFCGSYLK